MYWKLLNDTNNQDKILELLLLGVKNILKAILNILKQFEL